MIPAVFIQCKYKYSTILSSLYFSRGKFVALKSPFIAKQRHIISTADGSSSIFIPELEETYHSKFGSIAESQHIYINNGLKEIHEKEKPIKVFEMGFGTGLNALLTYIFSESKRCRIHYTSIDKYPLEPAEVDTLNFLKVLEREDLSTILNTLHSSPWEREVKLSNAFTLLKSKADMESFSMGNGYDIVFYDAFAPNVQLNLWTEEIFEKIHGAMKPKALLMTYCVKGIVKNNLKKVGFEIIKLKGPEGGKREVLKAIKK